MLVDILTPDKVLFSGEATLISVPGTKGSFQILKNHAPIISSLTKGVVEIKNDNESQKFEINGGIVEVLKNKVVILA